MNEKSWGVTASRLFPLAMVYILEDICEEIMETVKFFV